LAAFRRWVLSGATPERGWFSYLAGTVYVELTMEQAFTHNQVKAEHSDVLRPIVKRERLGYYFVDNMLLSNVDVDLSTEPDGMFVSFKSLEDELIRFIEGEHEGYVELEGTPDMVLEVVSDSSVHKDTVLLRDLYYRAGVQEYWLVDARGGALSYDILRRGPKKFVATRLQDGWLKSQVFGRSFRFRQETDHLGNPLYFLDVKD
jgi:Uma2 family endonuclease